MRLTDPNGLQLAREPKATTIGMMSAFRTYFQNGPDDHDHDFHARPHDRLKLARISERPLYYALIMPTILPSFLFSPLGCG